MFGQTAAWSRGAVSSAKRPLAAGGAGRRPLFRPMGPLGRLLRSWFAGTRPYLLRAGTGFRRRSSAGVHKGSMSQSRLGELLVREKLISLQQLRKAQEEQKKSGQNLGYTLAKLGYISDGEITNFLSSQYRLPAINLDEYEIDAEVVKLVSRDVCEKHRIIP